MVGANFSDNLNYLATSHKGFCGSPLTRHICDGCGPLLVELGLLKNP